MLAFGITVLFIVCLPGNAIDEEQQVPLTFCVIVHLLTRSLPDKTCRARNSQAA